MSVILLTAIAVILRIISNPVGNVFQKQLTAIGYHPLQVNFLTYLFLSLLVLPLAITVSWASLSVEFWIFAVLGGLSGAMGNGFLVKALQMGDLSVLGPINSYKSIVGIIVGIFVLGELPNIWGLLGVGLIIWGSYFVLETTADRFSWALLKRKEIQYRIWALVLTAIEGVLIKKIILHSSTNIAFISWCWFGAFFAGILFLVSIKKTAQLNERLNTGIVLKYLLLVGCIGTMQFTTTYVIEHMQVGYALALFQLSIIISVLLGHRIFGESHLKQKLIGSVIMIAGSLIIIFNKHT